MLRHPVAPLLLLLLLTAFSLSLELKCWGLYLPPSLSLSLPASPPMDAVFSKFQPEERVPTGGAWQVTRVSPYVRRPSPSKENRRISERDDPGPPVVPGGQGIGLDPETSRERVGDWGGPETVWALLCVAERRATRPNGEWGYRERRHMLGHERPEAVSPARGVVPTELQSSI